MSLESGAISGRWAIALRDLEHVLSIDTDKDGEISDAELKIGQPKIEKLAFDSLKVETGGRPLRFEPKGFEVEQHDDAVYVALVFNLVGAPAGPDLILDYDLFSHTDPLHRGLFRLDLPDRTETMIFSPAQPIQRFILTQGKQNHRLSTFVREGIWHIWLGFDHIFFLVALLLPAVLKRVGKEWSCEIGWKIAVGNIVKVVTAFTVAHSITLSLAALGLVRISPRIVEPIIAASVLLAGINNLRAIFPERTWVIAFTFGLIHGFGFASALAELGLDRNSLGVALFGFNMGVEIGQLAIVAAFIPLAIALRKTKFYQRLLLPGGSIIIAILAAIWIFERIADKKVLPF